MSESKTVFAANEIVAAMADNAMNPEQAQAFSADPHSMIASNANIDLEGIQVNVVQNTGSDVNLILPYYELLESTEAQAVRDRDLNDISGGEIFISLGVLGGVLFGAVVLGASNGIVIGCAIAGGAIGAAIVGTAIAGTIAGTKKYDDEDGGK